MLFNDKPTQLAMIAGNYTLSVGCTNVIGGTITAGTADAYGSALLTFSPPFIATPIILATAFSAASTTATIMPVALTGAGVSNVSIECYASGGSVGLLIIGEARL